MHIKDIYFWKSLAFPVRHRETAFGGLSRPRSRAHVAQADGERTIFFFRRYGMQWCLLYIGSICIHLLEKLDGFLIPVVFWDVRWANGESRPVDFCIVLRARWNQTVQPITSIDHTMLCRTPRFMMIHFTCNTYIYTKTYTIAASTMYSRFFWPSAGWMNCRLCLGLAERSEQPCLSRMRFHAFHAWKAPVEELGPTLMETANKYHQPSAHPHHPHSHHHRHHHHPMRQVLKQ